MNIDYRMKYLPLMALISGFATYALRLSQHLVDTDDKGLLVPGSPIGYMICGLTAAMVVMIIIDTWKMAGSVPQEKDVSLPLPSAAGCCVMAVSIAATLITDFNVVSRMDWIRNICGFAAVFALGRMGECQIRNKKPFFLLPAVVCLYLTLYAVTHYQKWSSMPQIQDYLFAVLASVLLPLFAYYQTAFAVGMGKRRMRIGVGLLAAFFSMACIFGERDAMLYLGGALWCLTNLGRLTPEELPEEDSNAAA